MTTASEQAPVARSYTRARRHPWVLGKLGEIRLWLGPYSRPQLVVAGVGLLMLGKTIAVWWPVFGPLPVVGLGVAVWAARCARIGGRVPEAAVWGWILLLAQPLGGRIGGRPARDPAPRSLHGGFFLAETETATVTAAIAARTTGAARPAGVRDSRPARGPSAPSVRSAQRRPQPPRPGRTTEPASVPAAPRAGEAAPCRPRSSLDLLLAQSGARTTSEMKA